MQRCVIIAGADIQNYGAVRSYLKKDDFIVCCDSGLKHMKGLEITPDFVIGDFDSHEKPDFPVETVVLPCEKDDTDTMAAIREMDKRGFDDFLLLGVFGNRLDHTLGNVYALLWLDNHGKKAMAVDDYSEFEIVSRNKAYITSKYPFFSLVNITGISEGITIKNAKYPLENAEITQDFQYGFSNEPLPEQTAEVTLKRGALLLIRDR